MISNLSIQGLAIIDSLSIDLSNGFNVITGETGAGKSILIRALNLLMGAKASSETVRQGFSQAMIAGGFRVPVDHPACLLLANLGIPVEDNGGKVTLLVRRQVTAKGKSQSWVNDVPVTAQVCRELGATLIDVFGQHENQKLLDLGSHTHYLDSFLKEPALLKRVGRLSGEVGELLDQVKDLLDRFRERSRDRDYLTYRLDALKEFDPTADDYTNVAGMTERVKNEIEIRDALALALEHLNSLGGESVSGLLRETARALGKKDIALLHPLRDKAFELAEMLDDLNFALEKQLTSLNLDEAEVDQARERLKGYQELFRKHSVLEVGELVETLAKMKAELAFIDSAAAHLQKGMQALAEKTEELVAAARELTQARKLAARSIQKRVEEELSELAMKGSTFKVEFGEARRTLPALSFAEFEELAESWNHIQRTLTPCGEQGLERAQFLLSSNPGEPELPLAKIASGGELSRIMLALKKALAADADTCVLVFDEIDAGISGRVADVVGKKMQELAKDFQVLCISHLPQVAVYADSHFLVKKAEKGARTETSIVKLTEDQSAREIARLLSGQEVSPTSLANARSLMTRARPAKAEPRKRDLPPPKKDRKEKEARP